MVVPDLSSQTFFGWRSREAATDCTSLTDGKSHDICHELDSNDFYVCEPDAGDCSGSEWKQINNETFQIILSNSAGLRAALSDETGTGLAVFGTAPTFTGGFDVNLAANDNITIDGRSNPREITTGVLRINHTPEALTENTRALFLDIDYNSVPNTEAIHILLTANNMVAGETMHGLNILGDIDLSSGGVIRAINVGKIVGAGTGTVHALHVEPEVDIVIFHASGSFGTISKGWDENGGFTDTTTAFNSSATDVTIFSANADAIYIGSASSFSVIAYVLNTAASNPGIKPVFEYSSGGGTPVWTTFMPTDGTAGFRENGLITWNINDLVSPTWAVATVNGQSAFYIQITRTQASLSTDAIEDLFEISTPTNYHWDKDGVLFVESLTTGVNSRIVTSEGISETVEIISHINDAFTESVEFTAMRHSDTTENGATFYAIRSRGTHISQAVVQENDIIFWLRGEGHDGTDFNDAASIIFKVDGTPGANDMPGRIEFYTSPDGSNALVKRMVINSAGDVIIGAAQINSAKVTIDGDSDQEQFVIQSHSTQTSDVVVQEQSDGTVVYKRADDGKTTIGSSGAGNIDLGVNTLTDSILGNLLKDWKDLRAQSAKIGGSFITLGATIEGGEGFFYLRFDASTTEEAVWSFRMPNTYDSNPVMKLPYSMDTATSGKVDLEVKIACITDGDSTAITTTDNFATLNEIIGGTTVPGTAEFPDEISISLTNDDSCAAGDTVIIHIQRDHDDADDTATGDLKLFSPQLEWDR